MLKEPIYQDDIVNLHVHAPNNSFNTHTHTQRETERACERAHALKEKLDKSIVMLGGLNTPLSAIDRITRQKINKDKRIVYQSTGSN